MGKLHELLAAEPSLKETARVTAQAVSSLFTDGKTRLIGQIRTYIPEEEEGQMYPSERVELATTVSAELTRYSDAFGAWIDAAVQKETTNTDAKAELIVDSVSFGLLPATALLNLESKLEEIIDLYEHIPTNDAAVTWTWDGDNGFWRSPVSVRSKSEKRQEGIVLYDATPEHPAQTQLITRDVRIGHYEMTVFSGALAESDKAARLERARKLLVAIKRARAKANDQEADKTKIASKIFAYINGSKPQS